MSKVVLTESELRHIVYNSVDRMLTEEKLNEFLGGLASGLKDFTVSPVSSLVNGSKGDTRYPMARGAAKIYNAFQKDPNKKLSANDFIWGEKGSKNGERGEKYNGKKDPKTAEHEIKQYGYGKPVIENNELAVYDENSASKISFIGDTKVLVGHCIGEDDRFENSGGLSKHYRTLANGNPKDINRGMITWLSNRDECFRATTKLEKSSGVKEIEFESTNMEEGAVDGLIKGGKAAVKAGKPLVKTAGKAIKPAATSTGKALKNIGRAITKVGKGAAKVGGAAAVGGAAGKMATSMGSSTLGGVNSLLDGNNSMVYKIENEILPFVLQSLCSVLSIEPGDPMYEIITSKSTKKAIMKRIEKSL